MKFNHLKILFVLLVLGIFLLSSCTKKVIEPDLKEPEDPATGTLEVEPILLSGIDTEKLSLSEHYSLDPIKIELKASQYELPLKAAEISNYDDFSGKIQLNSGALDLLNNNGFVVIKNPFYEKTESITSPYETLKDREIPIFITTDSLLHLYHIQFDETLRQIEEKEFYDAIWEIDKKLLEESIEDYNSAAGELKEAAKNNVAYFSVALSSLQPAEEQVMGPCAERDWKCQAQDKTAFFSEEELNTYTFEVPDFVKQDVDDELELIEKHSGFSVSPIFQYNEDYSQYLPRGHYTRSEKLKNYFKAFMWHGRISMLLKGDLISLPTENERIKEARIQTMQASLTASHLAENQDILNKWDRIYAVTAFYVGLSDDLGPYEYIESMKSVFGSSFDANDLDEDAVGQLKAKLAEYHPPAIYGGTGFAVDGGCSVAPPFNPEQADKCLENTKGFRLMGQRFIPDSYMFQNLVFGYVTQHFTLTPNNWNGEPFTSGLVDTPSGSIVARVFPRGLDVMALLGSDRAKELITESGDDQYEKYDEKFAELEEEFNGFSVEEWNKNLYWAWLYSLKPLLKEFDNGYPTFMQTEAWQDKGLTTALASWAELRHDTILYAKQSYTMAGTTSVQIEPEVVGYVEPVPEFYNRLLALTRMTINGLDEMAVLDDTSKRRLQSLESILERLAEISKKELENDALTQEDYDFIKYFGKQLKGVIADVDEKAQKTTIIADVHTDGNSGKVLEEGVGYVDIVVVAYKVPDGRILVGAGPVMTYYEFKHPMSDRLTDEKWREILSQNPPEMPEWTASFIS